MPNADLNHATITKVPILKECHFGKMKLWLLDTFCLHFWAWLLLYSVITPKSEDKKFPKVFNPPEFHFSEFQNWYFSVFTTIDNFLQKISVNIEWSHGCEKSILLHFKDGNFKNCNTVYILCIEWKILTLILLLSQFPNFSCHNKSLEKPNSAPSIVVSVWTSGAIDYWDVLWFVHTWLLLNAPSVWPPI